MLKTGVVERIELSHGDLGQQYTTINGKVYHTWFDFADGIQQGVTVEFEEELNAKICDCPHQGNSRASVYADVARITRILGRMGEDQ